MIRISRTVVVSILLLAVASATSDHGLPRSLQGTTDDDPRLRMSISEAYPCIPPDDIRRIHQDATDTRLPWNNGNSGAIQKECYLQQNHCGLSETPSACCRVSFEAGWLVCDAFNAFDFMPCVCNDNTIGSPTSAVPATMPPTAAPTGNPTTRAPTAAPTSVPTMSPTKTPTSSPTASPTANPTQGPTAGLVPTGDAIVVPIAPPTFEPTTTPVADPTDLPTANPTKFPTRTPTVAPVDGSLDRYTTENRFDADLNATIRQSQCLMDPPAIQFVQGSTFVYRYEVTRLASPVLAETGGETLAEFFPNMGSRLSDAVGEALGSGISDLSEDWTETVHDDLAEKYLICDGYDSDTVWILQSKPHVVDVTVPCTGSTSDNNNDDDADSNDSSSCVVVTAEARIIAYRSSIGEKTTKQLWTTTSYEEGAIADNFAREAVNYLEDRLNGSDGLLAPTFGTVFTGGEIVNDSTDGDSSSTGTGNSVSEDSGADPVDQDTSETEGGDGTSLWSDTTGGTVVGIESSNNNSISRTNNWLTPGAVATIAVVGACFLMLLILAALRQNKKNDSGHREDEEYLQDVGTPKSDYYRGRPVDHLDLSVSSNSSGEDAGPIIRSDLDLEHNGAKKNYRGRLARPPMVPKVTSPKHFHFSGLTSTVPSPRERSKMGPLNLADEFRENNSDRASTDDTTATGTHRGGIVTNSSSSSNHRGIVTTNSSSSNHRGIVTTNSSMSSNLPPPNQNSSPRLYHLRDTVKL